MIAFSLARMVLPEISMVESNLDRVIAAIERQEGFFPNSVAWRNKNPGNIKFGKFAKSMGAIGKDEQGHAIFTSARKGRIALRKLLSTKFAGWTLCEIGAKYAEDPLWAEGVSSISGVELDTVVVPIAVP